jgi:integrase
MPQKSPDTVHILEGKATLYKRDLSPHWHVRFKAHGKWERMTTKCEMLTEAKSKAVEIVTNAWFREKNDLPIVSKRFKSVALLAMQRMKDLDKANQGKATFKTYVQSLQRYHIPFFGNHNVDRIDGALLNEFNAWRTKELGRTPSASVINNHNSAINRVFDEALERGYMSKFQLPLLKNDGRATEKRPTITIEEYTKLNRNLKPWVAEARKGNESTLRQILRDYILVISHSGIRPGTEGMNLKWHSIYFYEKDGVRYLAMKVKGKTGEREVTLRHGAIRFLDRLRCMNSEWQKYSFEDFLKKKFDTYVFRVKSTDDNGKVEWKDMTTAFGKMFARFLERCELLIDPTSGNHRTLYSLRHMYATFALTYNRMSVYTLAKHMGTSVAMIEKHYGQIILRNNAAEIAGAR